MTEHEALAILRRDNYDLDWSYRQIYDMFEFYAPQHNGCAFEWVRFDARLDCMTEARLKDKARDAVYYALRSRVDQIVSCIKGHMEHLDGALKDLES